MITYFIVLLIVKLVSSEDSENKIPNIPPMVDFNLIKIEKTNESLSIYYGNNMTYLYYKCNNFSICNKEKNTFDYSLNISNLSYCNATVNITDECIEYFEEPEIDDKSRNHEYYYSEFIFVRFEILSYHLFFFGFLIVLYGSSHYILGMIFQFSIFLYFFIKDSIELFYKFAAANHPLFILTGSTISGGVICYIAINLEEKKKIIIMKTIYGGIFGYFLFKSIFYYIVIFNSSIKVLYITSLFIFTVIGFIGGYIFVYLDFFENLLFMVCSIIPGSYYIMKGISFIIGGYYSDIIAVKNELIFDSVPKRKILIYLFLQILIIVLSFLNQFLYYMKYKTLGSSKYISEDLNSKSDPLTNRNTLPNSSDREEEQEQEQESEDTPNLVQNSKVDESINPEGDASNEIDDQED